MIDYYILTPSEKKYAEIEESLYLFEKYFIPHLSNRVSLNEYALKLSNKAISIIVKDADRIVGFSSFYCNPEKISYLSLLAVHTEYRKQNIAYALIGKMIDICKEQQSVGIECEMHATNIELYRLYNKFGFFVKERFFSSNGDYKFYLSLLFSKKIIAHFPFMETPIYYLNNISELYNNNIYIKCDDIFPLAQGGNKARKLQYILYKAISEGYNAVVTTGDMNSNHNRATALMCAKMGLKLKVIVHNEYPDKEYKSMNMCMIRQAGAEVLYCSKNKVKETMDCAMKLFKEQGMIPFYIYGGGHCLEGSFAYYEAVVNLRKQINFQLDYVFFASGTGTTQAGIYKGMEDFFPKTKVIGISIARNKERGLKKIHESIIELEEYLGQVQKTQIQSILFDDSFVGSGYESIIDNVKDIVNQVVQKEGIIIDPTYSGKAFWGMTELLRQKELSNKNILFWNTGGIFNFLSSYQKLK